LLISSPRPAGPPGVSGDPGEEGTEGFSYAGEPGIIPLSILKEFIDI